MICRNKLQDNCIECQAEQGFSSQDSGGSADTDGDDEKCPITCGDCDHVFHYHCLKRWLKTRNLCPHDNKK